MSLAAPYASGVAIALPDDEHSGSCAVQSTVRDAHDRDFEMCVAEDACTATDEAEHQASMALLRTIAKVATIEELEASG
jgi:nicotinamidase-related amidase